MSVFPFNLLFSSAAPAIFTFLMLVVLILAGKVYLKATFPRLKGAIGEKKTRKALGTLPDNHVVVHDLLLQSEGGSAQIDHTVISPRGIFVIETKAYDGWIFGNEKSAYWTQGMGKKKKRFYNPARQNRTHVQALKNTLRYGDLPYWPVVVFGDACALKKVDTTTPVIHRKQLLDFILNSKKDDVLTRADILDIYVRLVRANVRSKEARKQHVDYVRTKQERLKRHLRFKALGE